MEGSQFTVKEIVLEIRADLKEHIKIQGTIDDEQDDRLTSLETSRVKFLGNIGLSVKLISGGAVAAGIILGALEIIGNYGI